MKLNEIEEFYKDVITDNLTLRALLLEVYSSIESIASPDMGSLSSMRKKWKNSSPNKLIDTMITDTQIARECISKIKRYGKNRKSTSKE